MLIKIPINSFFLEGELTVPDASVGLVLFVHGSGSSRLSPRNSYVAHFLNEAKIATLLIDLLTRQEDVNYENRFDIELLTTRVLFIMDWLQRHLPSSPLPLGLFGASTGAAAALKAAAARPAAVKAVVSRGGRTDLAHDIIKMVKAPTLLIVGSEDHPVMAWNQATLALLTAPKRLATIAKATHLFEESGCLEEVAHLAKEWFFYNFQN